MLSDKTPIPNAPQMSDPEESAPSRVDKVHGGDVVEQVVSPKLMNNPECEHEWEIDPSETDFIAYRCTKDKCGIVVLYDK